MFAVCRDVSTDHPRFPRIVMVHSTVPAGQVTWPLGLWWGVVLSSVVIPSGRYPTKYTNKSPRGQEILIHTVNVQSKMPSGVLVLYGIQSARCR